MASPPIFNRAAPSSNRRTHFKRNACTQTPVRDINSTVPPPSYGASLLAAQQSLDLKLLKAQCDNLLALEAAAWHQDLHQRLSYEVTIASQGVTVYVATQHRHSSRVLEPSVVCHRPWRCETLTHFIIYVYTMLVHTRGHLTAGF